MQCFVCATNCQVIQITNQNFQASPMAQLCENIELVKNRMFEELRKLFLELRAVDCQLFHLRFKLETVMQELDEERNVSQVFRTQAEKMEEALKMHKQKGRYFIELLTPDYYD